MRARFGVSERSFISFIRGSLLITLFARIAKKKSRRPRALKSSPRAGRLVVSAALAAMVLTGAVVQADAPDNSAGTKASQYVAFSAYDINHKGDIKYVVTNNGKITYKTEGSLEGATLTITDGDNTFTYNYDSASKY